MSLGSPAVHARKVNINKSRCLRACIMLEGGPAEKAMECWKQG